MNGLESSYLIAHNSRLLVKMPLPPYLTPARRSEISLSPAFGTAPKKILTRPFFSPTRRLSNKGYTVHWSDQFFGPSLLTLRVVLSPFKSA